MKTHILLQAALFLLFAVIISVCIATAQPAQDTLYINFNSHCEESDKDPNGVTLNYSTNQAQYAQYRALVKQIADVMRSKGAKWNYQSDWNFLDAGLKYDKGDASTNNKNLFRWLAEDNNGQIQLDPHAHETRYNYADVAKLLDSVSPVVKASKNVGGFTWNGPMAQSKLMNIVTNVGYTWDSLGKGLRGRVFPSYTWKADVLLGGASYDYRTQQTAHGQDLNHSGAWRPRDTTSLGYMNHTCLAALANLGVGGDALLSPTNSVATDVVAIMANVRSTITAMRANRGKFFVMQIQTNQRDFARAGYMDKISALLDSLSPLAASGQIKWATHTEKFTAWKTLYNERPNFYPYATGVATQCAASTTAVQETMSQVQFSVFPNPIKAASEQAFTRFVLTEPQHIRLSVYNVLGQEVAQMLDADLSAGEHVLQLNIQRSAFNTLFLRLQTPTFTHVQSVQVMP